MEKAWKLIYQFFSPTILNSLLDDEENDKAAQNGHSKVIEDKVSFLTIFYIVSKLIFDSDYRR